MSASFVVEYLDPQTLAAHPRNFRTHPEPQREALRASIEEHGWLAAPIWNKQTGRLVDGHARVELALEREEATVPCRVIDVDAAQEQRILASFDRIGSLAERDDQALASLLQELSESEAGLPAGWGEDDLAALLAELGPVAGGLVEGADPDAIPEQVETRCQVGEIWKLGEQRLGCLDCRDSEALHLLLDGNEPAMVFADPPYGISIVQTSSGTRDPDKYGYAFGGVKNGKVGGSKPFGKGRIGSDHWIAAGVYPAVIGDESAETALDAFRLCESLWPGAVQIWWGGNHYAGFLPCSSCWLVWDKENTGDFADAELAWTNQKKAVRIFRHMWNGLMKASERGEKRVHPTQKPVALAEWCYEQYGSRGDLVLDPFAGSGMSLIAAELSGRRWCGAELSPDYCSIILARWEQSTGQSAVLLEPA